MNIEDRLRAHLQEQGQRIQIESPGLPSSGPRSSQASLQLMAAAAAVLFVALTGAGLFFWNSEQPISEIAAGTEEEEQETAETGETDAEEQTDTSAADALSIPPLNVRPLPSPDVGLPDTLVVDDGWYYALSISGGAASPSAPPAAEEWEAAGFDPSWLTPHSLSVLDPESGAWSTSGFDDRYVATFSVDDGVVTAVSPGRPSGPEAAIGRSLDRGASWDWQPLESFPPADSYSLVVTEQEALLYTVDFGEPDFGHAISWAVESGAIPSPDSILAATPEMLTYLPETAADDCQRFVNYEARASLNSLLTIIETDAGENSSALEAEYLSLVGLMRDQAEALDCPWDSQWDTPDGMRSFNQAVADGVIDGFETMTVSWEDLGYTVAGEWHDFTSLFRIDGSQLEPLELPFENPGGYPALGVDGSLQISVFEINDAGDLLGETVWTTVDGQAWASQTATAADLMSGPVTASEVAGQQEPRAGGDLYRVSFLPQVESDASDTGLGFETELQRRSEPDGAWETVDLAEVVPGLDLTGRIIEQVTGTSLGVFVSLIEPVDGFPANGVTVVHTSDGMTWGSFDLDTDAATFHSTDDSVLVVGTDWTVGTDDVSVFESFLLTSAE